jgi:hypothetical protein
MVTAVDRPRRSPLTVRCVSGLHIARALTCGITALTALTLFVGRSAAGAAAGRGRRAPHYPAPSAGGQRSSAGSRSRPARPPGVSRRGVSGHRGCCRDPRPCGITAAQTGRGLGRAAATGRVSAATRAGSGHHSRDSAPRRAFLAKRGAAATCYLAVLPQAGPVAAQVAVPLPRSGRAATSTTSPRGRHRAAQRALRAP